MKNKFLVFMMALASVNWWIFLWTWTWGDHRPDQDVVMANAMTSMLVFGSGLAVWAYFKACEVEDTWKVKVLDRKLNEMLEESQRRIKK